MQIFFVFIFAALIRLVNLNQSLWLDEAVVAKVVQTIPVHLITTQFSPGDFHPPLYYLFMSMWSSLFGTAEIALRMPSVLFSLIAGWYVYKTGELLKNKRVGLWSAVFFLFNPLIVYYSQEARMYMMAVMLLSATLFYFFQLIQAVQSPKSKFNSLLFFNLFSGLAFATFYGSIFFIVTLLFISVIKTFRTKDFSTLLKMTVGIIITGVLLSPLLLQQIRTARFSLQEVNNWSLVLGNAEIKNLAMVFVKFTSGRISWFPKWSYYAVAGMWCVVVGALIVFNGKKNRLLTLLFVFPLIIGFLVSFWIPMMQYFRFLYLIVPMSILLAVAVVQETVGTHTSRSFTRAPIYIGIVLTAFSFIYLLLPQFHRENWKSLAYDIKSSQPVYMILPSSDPISYYRTDVSLFELRDISSLLLPETIQVVPYVSEIYGYDYAQALINKGCIKTSDSVYRGPIILEVWKCLRNA